MPFSEKTVEQHFALIEAAAVNGERCPQNKPFGPLENTVVTQLYARGMIKGEIFALNFRRMTILVGPNAGKHTASPPFKAGKPYKVIGGCESAVREMRGAPSTPRSLTREELDR